MTADPDELGKVIDNLTSNAVKYSLPGGTVRLEVGIDGDHAVVLCEDTGLGISAADQVHLFSAFHRSSNPEALSIPGTGLGLAISRRIAQMHGGEILVASELGMGSTFRLRLPLRDPEHVGDVVDSMISDDDDAIVHVDEVSTRRIGRAALTHPAPPRDDTAAVRRVTQGADVVFGVDSPAWRPVRLPRRRRAARAPLPRINGKGGLRFAQPVVGNQEDHAVRAQACPEAGRRARRPAPRAVRNGPGPIARRLHAPSPASS